MTLFEIKTSVLLIAAISSIANTLVNGTAQQFESKPFSSCPVTHEDHEQVKGNLLQEIGNTIEQLGETDCQPTTENGQTGELPDSEETTPGSQSPTKITAQERSITQREVSTTTELPQTNTCGNATLGWRQVAFINMSNTSHNCPPGLQLTSYSKRTCGKVNRNVCSSAMFSVGGSEYSQVCGRIIGYQYSGGSAFYGYHRRSLMIDAEYVEGVSLTHGPVGRREHIWTFAAGISEVYWFGEEYYCPCDVSNPSLATPPFVGSDYFCESGLHSRWDCNVYCSTFFSDDPLWDGQGCTSTSTCCEFNNPPWFTKNLANATTEDIELRLCREPRILSSEVPLELIELYVQ